jgi:hypothetical protein
MLLMLEMEGLGFQVSITGSVLFLVLVAAVVLVSAVIYPTERCNRDWWWRTRS